MNKRILSVAATAILAGGVIAAAVSGPAVGQGYDDYTTTTSSTPTTPTTAPATVKLGHSKLGKYLVTSKGLALYLFAKDTGKTSKCSGACAKAWPPLITSGKPKAGSGVKASLLGTTTRSDGKLQVTYNGHPLYRYDDDKGAGQHHGQKLKEFGAVWYVVTSSGKALGKKGY
jgi:predicted lipoprotein with Yx(FWY)xxD motif